MRSPETLLSWTAGIIVLLALAPAALSLASRMQTPLLGMRAGRLLPCPARPNCVCSEDFDQARAIAPLVFSGTSAQAWARAVHAVQLQGGQLQQEEHGYLHAIFRSRLYRFIDDLELRLDEEHKVIHLRSAARSGFRDFGVNRERAEQLRTLFRRE